LTNASLTTPKELNNKIVVPRPIQPSPAFERFEPPREVAKSPIKRPITINSNGKAGGMSQPLMSFFRTKPSTKGSR
jgi:hypothetical protein